MSILLNYFQIFTEDYPNAGFDGLSHLLEALRAYKLSFEAIYLHLLIRGETDISAGEVTRMVAEASMNNELWTEGWESIPRVRQRLLRIKESDGNSLKLLQTKNFRNSRSSSFALYSKNYDTMVYA